MKLKLYITFTTDIIFVVLTIMNEQGHNKKPLFLFMLIVGVAVDARPQGSVDTSGSKCTVGGKSGR